MGYCCASKAGAITLGTCGHVTNLLWILGYSIHQANIKHPSAQAGNGKSSADGVGGSLKKMADLAVSHGQDIMCAKDFVNILYTTNSESKIQLFLIDENEFGKFRDVAPLSLKSIKGTMQINQALWKSDNPQKLKFKYLSCICEDCSHYELCEVAYSKDDNDEMSLDKSYEIENEIPYNVPDNSPDDSVLSTESSQACSKTTAEIKSGDWVAVLYDTNWYPGIVEDATEDNLKISFMARAGQNVFWPEKSDIQVVASDEILCILEYSPKPISGRHFSIVEKTRIDDLLKTLPC